MGVYTALIETLFARVQEDNNDFRSSYSSSTLVIMAFLPRFQGNYTCVASNVFRMKKQTFYINGIWTSSVCSLYLVNKFTPMRIK